MKINLKLKANKALQGTPADVKTLPLSLIVISHLR
jgi:hypothetical protein